MAHGTEQKPRLRRSLTRSSASQSARHSRPPGKAGVAPTWGSSHAAPARHSARAARPLHPGRDHHPRASRKRKPPRKAKTRSSRSRRWGKAAPTPCPAPSGSGERTCRRPRPEGRPALASGRRISGRGPQLRAPPRNTATDGDGERRQRDAPLSPLLCRYGGEMAGKSPRAAVMAAVISGHARPSAASPVRPPPSPHRARAVLRAGPPPRAETRAC